MPSSSLSPAQLRHPLALAALLYCAAPLALAQDSAAAPGQAVAAFDIPAGPLAATLTRIGQAAGRTITADPALLAGRQAPPVRGSMTAAQALQQALAGSGLAFDDTPAGLRVRADAVVREPAMRRPAADAAPASSSAPAAAPAEAATLSTVVVNDQRLGGGSLMQPTRQVTVIEGQELDALRATSANLGGMLAKSVPGMSDSSRSLTDFGQTLRGRNVLVLVDGIPLNTNRDTARNLVNIDPSRIERVEVLRGSNAIYGSGATGGIVSVTTRPANGEKIVQTTVGAETALSALRPGRHPVLQQRAAPAAHARAHPGRGSHGGPLRPPLERRRHADLDGTVDQPMTGYRIPPLKMTAYVQYQPGQRWNLRAQLTWFGARDYRLADGRAQFARADVRSYYTVDLLGRYAIDEKNTVNVGVQNLFNRYYLPLYSQLMRSGSNNSRLPAAGTVLTASYTHRW